MATSQYATLKARGYRNGVTIRPWDTPSSELANYWPHKAGQEVPWVAARPVEAADDQRAALGWGLAGVLGDVDHRRKHGDHTPWSVISGVAKIRNIVWAIDINDPTWVEQHLLALCRMDDYDTTWIHYFNINGSQYNYAGQRQASSSDQHLHLSAKSGAWDRTHTLLFDVYRHYKGWPLLNGRQVSDPLASPEDDMALKDIVPLPDEAGQEFPDSPMGDLKAWVQTCLGYGLWQSYRAARDSAAALETARRVEAKVDQLAVGGVDYPALAKAVVDEQHRRLES